MEDVGFTVMENDIFLLIYPEKVQIRNNLSYLLCLSTSLR